MSVVIPMNSTPVPGASLKAPLPAVATYCANFAQYTKLLAEDKPMEAGGVAFSLGLQWRHDPYNLKGSKKEDRDGPRSARWVLGWNNAKAISEGVAPVTGPGIDSPAVLTADGRLVPLPAQLEPPLAAG